MLPRVYFKVLLLSLAGLLFAPVSFAGGFPPVECTAFSSSGEGQFIGRFINTSNYIVVERQGIVQDVDVYVDLDYPDPASLDITLLTPDGGRIPLGSGGGDETWYDSQATTDIEDAVAPFHGRFRPLSSLPGFMSTRMDGLWQLEVKGDNFGQFGVLHEWALGICYEEGEVAGCQTVSSQGEMQSIPDNGTLSSKIQINTDLVISDINLTTTIAHSANADLDIYLISPSGRRVEISTDNDISYGGGRTFDDEAVARVGESPFAPSFKPESSLGLFDYEHAAGEWTLEVTDDTAGGQGSLISWSLSICARASIQDPEPICNAIAGQGLPVAIENLSTQDLRITVEESGTLTLAHVRVNIQHTHDDDLDLYLISPSGTQVELSTDNGGAGDNYTNTLFDDSAPTPITAGTPPFQGGIYSPESPLSVLQGESITGDWYLRVVDDSAPDTGTVLSWSLEYCTVPATFCEEATESEDVAIPDGGTVESEITFEGDFTVDAAYVTLNIAHERVPDLRLELESPEGIVLTLLDDYEPGTGGVQDLTGTTLASDGGPRIDSGNAPFTGTYAALQPLALLHGTEGGGTWKLRIADDNPDVSGTLLDWSLQFSCMDSDGPCPAYDSADAVTPIPDAGEAVFEINVPEEGTVSRLAVQVDVAHPFPSEVQMELFSPSGNIVHLSTGASPGPFSRYNGIVFDDSALVAVNQWQIPLTGYVRPWEPLALLAGESAQGVWKLVVRDTAPADTGEFRDWQLRLCIDAPSVDGEGDGAGDGEGEGIAEGEGGVVIEGEGEGIAEGEGGVVIEGEGEGIAEGEGDVVTEGEGDVVIEGEGEGIVEGEGDGTVEGEGEGDGAHDHSGDQNGDGVFDITETMRVVQLYNAGEFHCDGGSEDGYAIGAGLRSCAPHSADYEDGSEWRITLSELLRLIQLYANGGYHQCAGDTEDGYCVGLN